MPSHAHVPGCARLNVMRLNAARLDYYESVPIGIIGGVDQSRHMRIEGAAVQHGLNDAPDTAAVTVHGLTPVAGQSLAIYHGDRSVSHQLFGGRILETVVRYESLRENVAWDLRGIDPTWLLNRRRALGRYTQWDATHIVRDLIVSLAPSVTLVNLQPDLPVIDEITFSNETLAVCLTAICERIGGAWYLDYTGDLHLFLTEATAARPISDANSQTASDLQLSEDLSQVVTRIIARGAGAGAALDLPAFGTELPIDLGDQENFYNVLGGVAEVGPRRITYAGVRGLGAVGALVGPGTTPSTAATLWQAWDPASLLTVGAVYKYAVTFVTATGETEGGPVVAGACTGGMPNAPTAGPTLRDTTFSGAVPGPVVGGVYHFRLAYRMPWGAQGTGPVGAGVTYSGKAWELYVGAAAQTPEGQWYFPALGPAPNSQTTQLLLYRTVANAGPGGPFYGCGYVGFHGGADWRYLDYMPPDGDLAQPYNLLPADGPPYNALLVDKIPKSTGTVPAVTGRKLYRTIANGTQLKLLATLNATDTGYADLTADAALGANIPTVDTSGLAADTSKQVNAGSTTLPVSSTTPFDQDYGGTGGWARVGNLVIRYTGLGTGTLTGLPATGPGALSATVRYGAQVLVQPRLTGVSGLISPIRKGETVTLRLEVEDLVAQEALAARLGSADRADGVVEEVYSDSGMTLAELADYAQALLIDRKDPRRTLTFSTRDPSCQVGRLITVTLTTPPISGTFRIQRVTFSEIAITGGLARVGPKLQVEATNKLFTFTDLWRRMRGREGGAL